MSYPFIISYVVSWVLLLVLAGLLVGLMRQVGLIRAQLGMEAEDVDPAVTERPSAAKEGPTIGTSAPVHELATMNGYGLISLESARRQRDILLLFLSPLCNGCHDVARFLGQEGEVIRQQDDLLVIISGNARATEAFLDLFPMPVPIVDDSERRLMQEFNVRGHPFGLVYNASGTLVRKGTVAHPETAISALLGHTAPNGIDDIFPEAAHESMRTIA